MSDEPGDADEFYAVALILCGFQCDACDTYFAPKVSFEAMGEAAKVAGWFVDTRPERWIVVCPRCRRRA